MKSKYRIEKHVWCEEIANAVSFDALLDSTIGSIEEALEPYGGLHTLRIRISSELFSVQFIGDSSFSIQFNRGGES